MKLNNLFEHIDFSKHSSLSVSTWSEAIRVNLNFNHVMIERPDAADSWDDLYNFRETVQEYVDLGIITKDESFDLVYSLREIRNGDEKSILEKKEKEMAEIAAAFEKLMRAELLAFDNELKEAYQQKKNEIIKKLEDKRRQYEA